MKKYIAGILFISVIATACEPAERTDFEERMAVNGTELFVKVMGHGEPLVVLHGGPGLSHDYFLPHLDPLAEEVKLVLFDQRGMGRSSVDLDSTSFSLDLLVEDIEALRRELGFEKIHLMGHSWGGTLAMRYAVRYPDRLETLILCNSVPASSEFIWATTAAFTKLNERQNMEDVAPLQKKIAEGSEDIEVYERLMQLRFRPTFYDTAEVNKLRLNFSENYLATRDLLRFLPPFNVPVNLLPDLEEVEVPALVIRAEMEAMPMESDQRLVETLPNARMINFDRAGHFPFIERQEAFVDTLLAFIRER